MFEHAKWIAGEDSNEIKPAPLFRKTFELKKEVKCAVLRICGLGLACCYINGKNVCDEVLTTPISKYDSRLYYNTYDVTNLLTNGANAIGCILGNGWYFVTYFRWDYYKPAWLHHPKLLLELEITYADGTREHIHSDTSWKTADSAVLYNETRRGEIFDARRYEKEWNLPQYDDSKWDNAFICRSPGGILQKRDFPPIRVTKRLKATRVNRNVYDMGENISGWVRIRAKGKRGTEITLRYSEILHEDGSIAPERLNTILGAETHTDKYIMSGDGWEEWAPSFAYHGFRFVEVTGAPEEFELVGEMLHTDVDIIGEFSCSDDMLNQIHRAARQSTLTNLHGIFTDCPQREQNGWTGDTLISAEQTLLNYDMTALYRKILLDIKDTQRPSGQICCIAPTGGWGYNWGSGPAWDSLYIYLPYYIYFYNGDMSVLEQMWDSMELYMDFMESMSEDNTVCFGLGDWCAPEGAELCPTMITDTAYFYMDNKIMARCAELLHHDETRYAQRASEIKAAFRRKFIEEDFYLGDNTTAISCAIYQDLYTEEEKPLAVGHLSEILVQKGYHIDCGILGMKYLFSALSEYGYAETVYKMCVNPEYPSYAYWINNGMTTLCEHWDMKESCNHHMYSEIDMWFYKHLAGIHINEGADSVTIQPYFLEELKWVKAKHKGIEVCWNETEVKIKSNLCGKLILGNHELPFDKGEHSFRRDFSE